jgi:hypothetical protein
VWATEAVLRPNPGLGVPPNPIKPYLLSVIPRNRSPKGVIMGILILLIYYEKKLI